MEKELSTRGYDELYSIGKRYMERLSKIPGRPFLKNVEFRFESTCKYRSQDRMFGNTNESIKQIRKFIPCESDTLYRFYDHCKTYKSLHDCLDEYKIEEEKFLNKSTIITITLQINRKLKLNTSDYLTPSDIKTLYVLCAYKRIVKGINLADWPCSLFNDEALNTFEYLLDLKQYYKTGNAHKINLEISCPLFQTAFNDIKKYLRTCNDDYMLIPKKIKGTFGFAHAETLLPLLGFFGFFNSSDEDQNISQIKKNFEHSEKFNHNRIFRAGYFSPMGGNIMFAVACPIKKNEEGVVMALLNENPIPLPCCKPKFINNNQSYPVCTLEFINCFAKQAKQCNFLKICSTPYECKK
ncbi:hypothetical protein MXB_586 [Myxobolus squamalis]|nr:hypothetical protein MXB_586 [Myxobolus squamalis]